MTNLNCSEMRVAGHEVEAQFQLPVPVDDFMHRSTDQLLNRSNFSTFNFPTAQDGSMQPMMRRRRKSNSTSKPLPPSKSQVNTLLTDSISLSECCPMSAWILWTNIWLL
ncbi:hypothetical protein K7X08_012576 [Anisodus acutangulus]|uniref:Uncharacterized protein n=1 Tax=Anisodus acutangulus TaxID=402998 RepID=A0A9Q1LD52_9SOLA|nr:hypothetical protein K7X08_012576 [Anisodus acutangulus]